MTEVKEQVKSIELKAVLVTLKGHRTGDMCWELKRVGDVGLTGQLQKETYSIKRLDGLLSVGGSLEKLMEATKK